MRALTALGLAMCLLLGGRERACAQIPDAPTHPSEDDFAVARDAFVEGIAHAQRRRHRQALEAFERSYRLSGSTAALYNLASTLRHLGRYTDAADAVSRLLSVADLDAETRGRALTVQEQARSRLARLVIRDVPAGEADVLVDGRVQTRERTRPLVVALDPGLRVVRVELPGRPSFTWSESVGPGEAVEARARYDAPPPISTAPASTAPASTAPASEGAASSDGEPNWVVILGVGLGGLALVAGGIVLGLVLAGPSIEPRTDLVIRLP